MKALIVEPFPIINLGIKQVLLNNFDNVDVTDCYYVDDIDKVAENKKFDIIIFDIDLSNTDVQSAFKKLRQLQSEANILIYSDTSEQLYAIPYISMGASGFLQKSASIEDFVMAIRLISAGKVYLTQKVFKNNFNGKDDEDQTPITRLQKLSNRELQVFEHLLEGKRLKEITEIMGIHQSTVSTLKKKIFTKTGVTNLISLKNLADQSGF